MWIFRIYLFLVLPVLVQFRIQAQVSTICNDAIYFFRDDVSTLTQDSVFYIASIQEYNGLNPYATNICTLPATLGVVNGLALNPLDTSFYFMKRINSSSSELMRIDKDCNMTIACTLPGYSVMGDIDNKGRYWTQFGSQIAAYDVQTGGIVKGPFASAAFISHDIAFNPFDCNLYFGKNNLPVNAMDTNGIMAATFSNGFTGPIYGGLAFGSDRHLYGMTNYQASVQLNYFDLSLDTAFPVTSSISPGSIGAPAADMTSWICNTISASAIASSDSGCAPLTVNFQNQSNGWITSFQWSFDDPSSGQITSFSPNPSHTFNSPGTYSVMLAVESDTLCLIQQYDTVQILITVFENPQIQFTDTIMCNNSPIVLDIGISGMQYSWLPNGDTTKTIVAADSGLYIAQVRDNYGCEDVDSIMVTLAPQLHLSFDTDSSFCNDSNGTAKAIVTGGAPGYTFSWNTAPVQTTAYISNLPAGDYTVVVQDNNNCIDSTVATIHSSGLPVLSLANIRHVSCFGLIDGSAIAAVSGGSPPYTYQWEPTGNISSSAQNLASGIHIAKIYDDKGCSTMDSVLITEPPQLEISTSSQNAICNSDNGEATAIVSGGVPIYSYQWNDPNMQTSSVAGSLPAGIYVAAVTDGNGCLDSTLVEVFQSINNIHIEITPDDTLVGLDASFYLSASGGVSYSWEPTDGLSQPLSSTTLLNTTNLGSGDLSILTYVVTVTDQDGCKSTDSIRITINSNVSIYLPNTIIPASDGQNNEFKPIGNFEFSSYNLKVFNRWGEMCFESLIPNKGWKGTNIIGQPVMEDAYVYKLEGIEKHTDIPISILGVITVLR